MKKMLISKARVLSTVLVTLVPIFYLLAEALR